MRGKVSGQDDIESAFGIDSAYKQSDANQLRMLIWPYMPEFPRANQDVFMEAYDENVLLDTISGDYPALLETKYLNKDKFDLQYVLGGAMSTRWVMAGWITEISDMWDICKIKKELFPAALSVLQLGGDPEAGEIYGLPYFTSIQGTLEANLLHLEKAGMVEMDGDTYVNADKADWPKTYEDMNDDLYEFKANGIAEHPYLPFWFHDFPGIGWGFSSETMNRDCDLVDPATLEPVFEVGGCVEDLLVEHKQLLDDGIVAEGILTGMETDLIDWFSTGKYTYTRQQTYDCFNHNDAGRSQIAGHAIWLPPSGTNTWGLFMEGFYGSAFTWTDKLLAGEEDDSVARGRQLRHHQFNGYRDNHGEIMTARAWVERQALGSGYPEVQNSQATLDAYQSWLPKGTGAWQSEEVIVDLFAKGRVPPIWRTFWFTEWNSKALTLLQQAILGQRTPSDVTEELREHADKLFKRYG
jgi:hypothetical protein